MAIDSEFPKQNQRIADADPGLYESASPHVLPNTCVSVQPVHMVRGTMGTLVECFGTYRDAATGKTSNITNPDFVLGARVHQA